jgi:uncharacterized protein (TIGR02270 family)
LIRVQEQVPGLEEHGMFPDASVLAEDTAHLWRSRSIAVAAPHMSLIDLVRLDERLEAHVDALMIASRAGLASAARDLLTAGDPYIFVALSLAVRHSDLQLAERILSLGEVSSGAVSAIVWADRNAAAPLIHDLLVSAVPQRRATGIAVAGLRRFDPGVTLKDCAIASSSKVRARAYRATGQLGRADLMAQLAPGLEDDDPECRFWSAWAAARMGANEPLNILAEIAWNNLARAEQALDLLLRRLEVPQANAWLHEFAKLPDRQRSAIRATGVIGDPRYLPWLIERLAEPATARLAGEAFSMITGVDLAYRDLDRRPPPDFQSGPNDDPDDEDVALDEDDALPWPDPERIGEWWTKN